MSDTMDFGDVPVEEIAEEHEDLIEEYYPAVVMKSAANDEQEEDGNV